MKILSVNFLSSSTLNIEETKYFVSFGALTKYLRNKNYIGNKFGIMDDSGVEERFDITEENIRKAYDSSWAHGLSPLMIVRTDFALYTVKNFITICETEVIE